MKQFRFVINGRSGKWREYDLAAFLRNCEAYAENDVEFYVEFEPRASRARARLSEPDDNETALTVRGERE